ncbi:MAG: hypothetical protein NTW19_02365 [Planctomycetota bacterium]|nr:hypothetical protein [Planctomycetota bacterium]
MDEHQDRFLADEFFSLTLMGTVQRAGVYNAGLTDSERKRFQSALRSQLEQVALQYQRQVPEEDHIRNILELSQRLTADHAAVLRENRFRIGSAQKALNLYLKYLWCIGKIPAPPHCPFDSQVIKTHRAAYSGPSWTELDDEVHYRSLVRAAKTKANGSILAAWELHMYNHLQS